MTSSLTRRLLLGLLCMLGVLGTRSASGQGGPSSADLSSLTLNAGTLDPTFAPVITNYTASVANVVSNISVTATASSGSAMVELRINGGPYASVASGSPSAALPLDIGANSLDVKVTSGNLSNTKTYSVAVVRNLPQPPDVQTIAVSVSGTTATLSGTVNPQGLPTTAWFEWGVTTNYGSATPAQTLGNGVVTTNFSQALTGLYASTYNVRAAASNSIGTAYGTNRTFTPPLFTLAFANLTQIYLGALAWGDLNNDGRLDLLLSGSLGDGITAVTECWTNSGSGFSNSLAGLIGLEYSSAAWGDLNNDGWLDVAYGGYYIAGGAWRSLVASNKFNGFSNFGDAVYGLPQPYYGTLAWGDYDNDGRLDLLFAGVAPGIGPSQICRNTGNGFTNINAGLPNTSYSSAAWGDYDNDGRLDLVITGTGGMAQIWRNTGKGFTNIGATLPRVAYGSVAWGDYDNDGRLDLLFSGADTSLATTLCQVWRNTGSGFSNINAGLPGIGYGAAVWGDYDNDGRLDILLAGSPDYIGPTTGICQIWRNTGNGFTNVNAGLPGVFNASVAWGDYDNDGRLDVALCGTNTASGRITQIWHNNAPSGNTPPSTPTGLRVVLNGITPTFTWDAASDAQTPSSGLSYNLRVGTTPGGSDVIAVMAAANGRRRLPQLGNCQMLNAHSLTLSPGQHYYWSVQAVDTAFAGSAFAVEQDFTFNSVFTPPNGVPVPGDVNGDGVVSGSELNLVLSNYFATSPWLQLTNVAGLGATNVTFALTNDTTGTFQVEYTTDFSNWYLLGPATLRYLFTDTNAPVDPQRYYRLRWP